MNIHFEVLSNQILLNGYNHLTLQAKEPLHCVPGEALCFEDTELHYIFNSSDNQVECIVAPEYTSTFKNQKSIVGKKKQLFHFPALRHDCLHVLLCNHQNFAAALFFLKSHRKTFNGLVIIETTQHFSFAPCPSPHLIPYMPDDVIASLPLLNDWNIANRLASRAFIPGCFEGSAQALYQRWQPYQRKEIQTIILK